MSTTETVDTMTLNGVGLSGPLRVTKILRNGKRRFDPVEKERLIDAALEPGVSVAGLTLEHGVNANQLRNWITLRRRRQETGNALTVLPSCAASAFIPVVEAASITRPPATTGRPTLPRVRVKPSLPNGVRLELEGVDAQALSAMIEALGRCDVPADDDLRIYLHREPIDFRAGINSLAILVEQSMGLNPFDRAVLPSVIAAAPG